MFLLRQMLIGRSGVLALVLTTTQLLGCGGGGGDDDEDDGIVARTNFWSTPPALPPAPPAGSIAGGVFRDADVAGLDFEAPGLTGTTTANGRFEYVVRSPIEFRVGSVSLGTIESATVDTAGLATPVRLARTGPTVDLHWRNIARFLQMLDQDGNPENGIVISEAVRAVAQTWPQVDFLTADLATELGAIMADADAADGTTHILPSAADAEAHLLRSYYCSFDGLYRGTVSGGGVSGILSLVVYDNGEAFGVSYDAAAQSVVTFRNGFRITAPLPSGPAFLSLTDGGGVLASGPIIPAIGVFFGNWSDSTNSGTYEGARAFGSDSLAVYRFAGYEFPLGTAVIMSFEVYADGQISGAVIDLDSVSGNGAPVSLSGTLTGTTFSASSANSSFSFTGTFDPSVAPTALAVSGTLRDARKNRNISTALRGCRLN